MQVYITTCDLIAGEGDECSADGETFKSLIALLERLGLSLSDLKAIASDGASVMTGKHTGVGARFKEIDECKAMLSVHCICHLACANNGDSLEFVKFFETTLTSVWAFFKSSPKRLKIYIKTTLGCRNVSAMAKNQKNRWLFA